MAIRSPVDPASLVAAAVAVALFFATPAGWDLVVPAPAPVGEAPRADGTDSASGSGSGPADGAGDGPGERARPDRTTEPARRAARTMRIARAAPPVPDTAAMARTVRSVRAETGRLTLAEALATARARQTILGIGLAALTTPRRMPQPERAAGPPPGPTAAPPDVVTVLPGARPSPPAGAEDPFAGDGPPVDKDTGTILYVSSADTLLRTFDVHDFSYLAVQKGEAAVPRVFVKAFPDDIADVDRVDLRKRLFLDTLLPIVLAANEAILADRARLAALAADLGRGVPPSLADAHWLAALAQRYEVPDQDLDALRVRVDSVPPSMALAQAAVESGWGTSSLARRGNALFGQIVIDPADGIPSGDGDHGYAAFDTLSESVASYARNLNTHPAYAEFRAERARLRAEGRPLDGDRLMGTLTAYSERGQDYVDYVRRLMRANDLELFDRVRLDGGGAAPRWPGAAAGRT